MIVLISLYQYENYASRMLFAHLNAHGIEVSFVGFKRQRMKRVKTLKNELIEIYDYCEEPTPQDIDCLISQLRRLEPDLIGINVKTAHSNCAKTITSQIRKSFDCPVIWGGPHPTIDPEECIKHTDMICVGEGFMPLLELSRRIEEKRPCDDVNNIWLNRGGKVIKNGQGAQISDLDELPFASFDGRNKYYIEDGSPQPENNFDYLGYSLTDDPEKTFHHTMTAFGCPIGCSYCINYFKFDKLRRRSVGNVIEELVGVRARNPRLKMVMFWDNIFTTRKTWCLEFAKIYKKEVQLPFYIYVYPHDHFTDRRVLFALRDAGLEIVNMGIQSGNPEIRKKIYNRSETNDQILKAARVFKELKLKPYYDFIKDNPLEKEEDLKMTLDLILEFPKPFVYQAFNLVFFPNYNLTKRFLDEKLITDQNIEGKGDAMGGSGVNWVAGFDIHKDYEGLARLHEYHYILASLAQFEIMPNALIRKIEEKKWFLKKIRLLYLICKLVRIVDICTRYRTYKTFRNRIKIVPWKMKLKHRILFRYK